MIKLLIGDTKVHYRRMHYIWKIKFMQRGRELGFFFCLVGWEKQRKEIKEVHWYYAQGHQLYHPPKYRKKIRRKMSYGRKDGATKVPFASHGFLIFLCLFLSFFSFLKKVSFDNISHIKFKDLCSTRTSLEWYMNKLRCLN